MRRKRHVVKKPEEKRVFTFFGEWVTGDELKLYNEKDLDKDGKSAGHVFNDLATNFLGFAAVFTGSGPELYKAIKFFMGTSPLVTFYSDNASAYTYAVDKMDAHNPNSMPYDPKNNSVIERKNGLAIDGGRCNILQAGVPASFWPLLCCIGSVLGISFIRKKTARHLIKNVMVTLFIAHKYPTVL